MQFWAPGLLLGLAVTLLILEWISAPIEWLWPYQLKGNTHWRGQISGNCISLTFDDGPSRYTEQILDILKAHGVAATFRAASAGGGSGVQATHRFREVGRLLYPR